jgi:DNA-binding transcriptional MerR regulator
VAKPINESGAPTYPLRTASRLTGVSPALLRAWEKRYEVVVPVRTAGGTRRYSAHDLSRLKLVKAAVDAGHRIGRVAQLDTAELERLTADSSAPSPGGFEEIFAALDRLDANEAQRLLGMQLSSLGPTRFARDFAIPLVREIGERWASKSLNIASEHLATAVLRSMFGSALRPNAASQEGPTIVFATPPGERHELGLQMAALTAMGAGANPVYLGAELPLDDLLHASARTRASAIALSMVTISPAQAEKALGELRAKLPNDVHLWVGGHGAAALELTNGTERFDTLEALEQRVALLRFEPPGAR